MSHQILIRASRARSVIAHYDTTDGAIQLIRLSPDAGPLPDYAHLIGQCFPDQVSLRLAVIAALSGPVGDTLDHVLLSRDVYDRWNQIAAQAARKLPTATDPALIPDERARALSGGRLMIWVDLPEPVGTVKLIVAPGEWAWRAKPN